MLAVGGVEVELPMRRLPYDEAISRYGTDKPDLRFGLELVELTDVFRESEFKAFAGAIDDGALVRGLNAGKQEMSRGDLDGFVDEALELGAKGLVWAVVEADGWRSPVAKFLSDGRSERPTRRSRRQRATCCCWSPTRRTPRRPCSASCAAAWASGWA